MLSNVKKTNHICADATYKLTIVGAPVLIVGTTDKAKVFHPFGIAVTSSETAIDFKFIFKAVKKGCFVNEQYNYKPTALIADGAGAITNGFMTAFGYLSLADFIRVYCWAHVNVNLDKKVLIGQKSAVLLTSHSLWNHC